MVKTLRLQNLDKTLLCRRKSGSDEYKNDEKKSVRKKPELNAYLIIFPLEQTLVFLLWGGLPLDLALVT